MGGRKKWEPFAGIWNASKVQIEVIRTLLCSAI